MSFTPFDPRGVDIVVGKCSLCLKLPAFSEPWKSIRRNSEWRLNEIIELASLNLQLFGLVRQLRVIHGIHRGVSEMKIYIFLINSVPGTNIYI